MINIANLTTLQTDNILRIAEELKVRLSSKVLQSDNDQGRDGHYFSHSKV